MAQIAQEAAGLGNLLKRAHPWMDAEGYGIEIATIAADQGQVVKKTGSTWAAITAAPTASNTIGVVLDATKEDATKKRILIKGEAIVGKNALVYFAAASDADKLATNALLEVLDIQVNDQI